MIGEVKYCPFCGNTTIIKWRSKVNKGKKYNKYSFDNWTDIIESKVNKGKKYKCIRCGKEFDVE